MYLRAGFLSFVSIINRGLHIAVIIYNTAFDTKHTEQMACTVYTGKNAWP